MGDDFYTALKDLMSWGSVFGHWMTAEGFIKERETVGHRIRVLNTTEIDLYLNALSYSAV